MIRVAHTAGALALTLVACSGDGLQAPVQPVLADFVGTFEAQRAVVVNPADPTQQFDLVRSGGAFALTMDADGRFVREVTLPGSDPVVTTGSLALDGNDALIITEDDTATERNAFFQLRGDRLHIVDTRTPAGLLRESLASPVTLTLDLRRRF